MDPEQHSEHHSDSSEDNYTNSMPAPKSKRRRTRYKGLVRVKGVHNQVESIVQPFSLDPLLDVLNKPCVREATEDGFEQVLEPLLPMLLEADGSYMYGSQVAGDTTSSPSRLLSISDSRKLYNALQNGSQPSSILASLLVAKARLHSRVLRRVILNRISPYLQPGSLTPLQCKRTPSTVNPQVLDALYAIQTTPYENSFLSRVRGSQATLQGGVISVDWDTRTPWMDLMSDIREHHSLAHPERDQTEHMLAPIVYRTLQRHHLDQIHELLVRAFWEGINVTDSLDYSPEKCTIVATYKQLVVGAAFLSSPQETYITYLAVRSGWDNSQIATSMLYHLINLNPHKDITLHVSINNPAMLLYNRFGFKAEEFVVGFYEDYLDPDSPESKNAFRLRLRRW